MDGQQFVTSAPLVLTSPNGFAHEATGRDTLYNDPRTRFVASQGDIERGSSKPLTALYPLRQRPRHSSHLPVKPSNASVPFPHLPLREARVCRLENKSPDSAMRLAGFWLICMDQPEACRKNISQDHHTCFLQAAEALERCMSGQRGSQHLLSAE
ncbi:hypothetical protein LZ32DRAFT_287942 [Colletotrichum eremochloae]|nr:hypothetical protein LZ32DRAFT_287942 [Colletotrichum eremochloae]